MATGTRTRRGRAVARGWAALLAGCCACTSIPATNARDREEATRTLVIRAVARGTETAMAGVDVTATIAWDDRTPAQRLKDADREGCLTLPSEKIATKTDAVGRAVIELPDKELQSVSVALRKAGHTPMKVIWSAGNTDEPLALPPDIAVPMEPALTIGGGVQDEGGRPIAGATVSVFLLNYEGQFPIGEPFISENVDITTDGEGRWTWEGVPVREGACRVLTGAAHPDFAAMRGLSERGAGFTSEDLRARSGMIALRKDRTPTARVRGRVVDAEGGPIAGARVQPGYEHGEHLTFRFPMHDLDPIMTDADGRFCFERIGPSELPVSDGTPPKELILTVQADGWAPETRNVRIEATVPELEFRLQAGRVLCGRIVAADGRPVAAVKIDVSRWHDHRGLHWRGESDSDGRFEWRSAPDGPVDFSFRKAGYIMRSYVPLTPAEDEQVVTLSGLLRIHGVVRDAQSGEPIANARMRRGVLIPGNDTAHWTDDRRALPSGAYEAVFEYEQHGFQLRFEADGYAPLVSCVFRATDGEVEFDALLEQASEITGIVIDGEGRPVGGAVTMFGGNPRVHGLITFCDGELRRDYLGQRGIEFVEATAGADGRFSLRRVANPLVLVATHQRGAANLSLGQMPGELTVRLTPWGRIEGTLVRGDVPWKYNEVHAYVMDRDSGGPIVNFSSTATTNAQGRFVLESVRPGTADMGPIHDGPAWRGPLYSQHVSVVAGATSHVQLGGGGCIVRGTIEAPAEIAEIVSLPGAFGSVERRSPNEPDRDVDGPEAVLAWWDAYRGSDEYCAALAEPHDFHVRLDADGRFELQDVPVGTFILRLTCYRKPPPGQCMTFQEVADLEYVFDVPPRSEVRILDLGRLRLHALPRLDVGAAAPLIETLLAGPR